MSVNVTSSWMGMMTVRTLEITITDKTDSSQGSVDLVKLLTRAIWIVETDGQFIVTQTQVIVVMNQAFNLLKIK